MSRALKILQALNDIDDKFLVEKEVVKQSKFKPTTFFTVLLSSIVLAGGVYAGYRIISPNHRATITPTPTSQISTIDTNKVWIGTFNLVWNDFQNEIVKHKIEFEDGESKLADELNKQSFTVRDISQQSYYKICDKSSLELRTQIEQGIKAKFNEESGILDKINWDDPYGYVLYAILKKNFTFVDKFDTSVGNIRFNNSEEYVKTFGATGENNSVEILYYKNKNDFAVKLKTKEKEDIILYKVKGEGKSFEENYDELNKKANLYKDDKVMYSGDVLKIPVLKVHDDINYDELCNREIKDTNGLYIQKAIQTIDFEINEKGGEVKSEALIKATRQGLEMDSFNSLDVSKPKEMIFDSDFILYLKEEEKDKPYFALKVDDVDVMEFAE